ncbi:hypothetical protein JOF56_006795 [Kibdelosporangium banguiense]|uniref:Uncharacterized protein n=1 Tax=Kibdelosporangium banguiense TaxID=1365924 RepID=A0ABS4TPS8_9PSEU|nr:hypothetical protein [Kibdelosporangium banguiense]MBP2326410.1 hypothetical protein [Kibdelosporangium banguiense]
MPASTGSWFGERIEPVTVGLRPDEVAEIMRDELRELPLPPHPISLQPFVIPRTSYRELLQAAGDLLGLIRRSMLHSGTDRASRIAALGIDPADCPIWTDDEEWELRHCADLARADVVLGVDGPKFVEFNVSGAFGGMLHFQLYQRAWQRVAERAGQPAFVSAGAFARFAGLIERTCAELGVPPSIALVGTPREWGPRTPPRHFLHQADLLRQHGIEAVHLDFEELLDGIGAPGDLRYPLGVAQFTVRDANDLGYDISPAQIAQTRGFRLIPSASAWLLHTKKHLALLSEGQPWMTAQDHDLAARYLPWSRIVGDRKVRWRDGHYELTELLLDQRENFVLKGATGCSGAEVVFGGRSTPQEWAALVEEAARGGYHIVQEVVPAQPMPVDVMEESGEVNRIVANPVISPFVIDGTAVGCFGRFVADQRPGIISALSQARLTCLLAEA